MTYVFLKDNNPRPVLVIRGTNVTRHARYPDNADYHLVFDDIRPVSGDVNSGNFLHSADQEDGQALLRQIASFPWCNGRIAMEGSSNAGICDYLAAPGAVALLRGIRANFATGDLLNYGFFNGGVLHHETSDLYGHPTGTLAWVDYVGLGIWDKYLITISDAVSARVAGLHRGGWFDVFGQGTLDSFSRLQKEGDINWRNRQKAVIGPWLHGGNGTTPVGQLTFPSATDPMATTYNTYWRKGVFQNDWTDWQGLPPVRVYHMGAPAGTEWRTYSTWPPPAVEYPLYFASGGNLVSKSPTPAPGQVTFTSNPDSPCPTLGGTNNLISLDPEQRPGGTSGPYDQRQIEARHVTPGDVAVFTSISSGAGGTLIVGRIYADVWIQTDLPDIDVFVRMTDVYPGPLDGRSMLMAQGIQRARYRNGTCPRLLLNVPTRVRVDLGSTALVVREGHKVRVTVSAAAGPSLNTGLHPLYDINPQNGDEYSGLQPKRSGSITILFGTGHLSALVIPLLIGHTPPRDRRPNTTPCRR